MAGQIARHRTALSRCELSRPFKAVIADGVLRLSDTVMDYGCGRGGDVRRLVAQGYQCFGWDPVHAPSGFCQKADLVNLGYVVNVIESAQERRQALETAWGLARRVLVVAARLVAETPSLRAAAPYADGLVTRIGTFQKFYEQQELRSWIEQTLGVSAVAAAPGIIYVFRDPAERAAFQAARFRRAVSAPRLTVTERLLAAHRPLLDSLAGFVSNRGRLPGPWELPEYGELETALGSIGRAFRVVQKASDPGSWGQVRKARSEDLLVYLALARFDGRPKLFELPPDIQLDVKAFFGPYTRACAAADDLLFSLGDPEKLEEACRASSVGKAMPTALYVHVSAVADLPIVLRLYEGCARSYAGTVPGANIVKLGRGEPKISYLSYPDFETDPHPALASSVTVHLQTFRVRERSYKEYKNPPILHRKEEFVGASHPERDRFARLTRFEEAKGLFDTPSAIGTRDGWNEALKEKGLLLKGHRLISAVRPEKRRAR